MASKYWIKLYHEILDDPKMGRLSDALFRRTIELFLIAGEYGCDGALPPPADVAWRLRMDEAVLLAQMEDLAALNILSLGADGGWLVVHFKVRQAPSPAVERMRRSRVSATKKRSNQPDNGYDSVAKRNPDTETDADAEQDSDQRTVADAEAESTAAGILEDELVKLFLERTGLPPYLGGAEKWRAALARMRAAGVEADDLDEALDDCRRKKLTIASLASVATPAIITRSRRKAGNPDEDYRRYLKGEYGEVGSR